MTETTAGASINYKGNMKIGSVGRTLPGTELKTDTDGEIMFRGRHVMKGYYNNLKPLLKSWMAIGFAPVTSEN